jgi:hypothetical protein
MGWTDALSDIEAVMLASPESRLLTGTIPTGASPDLILVQRTLARALSALAPEAGGAGEAGRAGGEVIDFLSAGRAATVLHGAARPAERAGADTVPEADERAMVDTALGSATAVAGKGSAVRPSRGRSVPPGLPQADTTTAAAADFDLVAPPPVTTGPGATASIPSFPMQPTAFPGSPARGPALRGGLPLVAPALSAVSATSFMSRKEETRPAASRREAARETADHKGPAIDLDTLAAEMTDRIARRLKRDKERRGFHG